MKPMQQIGHFGKIQYSTRPAMEKKSIGKHLLGSEIFMQEDTLGYITIIWGGFMLKRAMTLESGFGEKKVVGYGRCPKYSPTPFNTIQGNGSFLISATTQDFFDFMSTEILGGLMNSYKETCLKHNEV
jgi:hypothetical protein